MSSRTATGTAASWCFWKVPTGCAPTARRPAARLSWRGCGRTAPVRLMRPSNPWDVATVPTRAVWGFSPAGASRGPATCGCAATGRARTWRASPGCARPQSPYLGGGELGLHRCARLPDSARRTMARAGQPGLPRYLGTGGAFGVRPVGRRACAEHYEPLESPLNNRLNGAYASPVRWRPPRRHPVPQATTGRWMPPWPMRWRRTTPLCRRIARPIPLRRSSTARTAATALGAP